MKRQVLKSFITLCAAVMAVCAASFVTSCDKYDDGPLKEEIAALKDRVTKLEKDLGEQVKALQALSALQEAADILIGTNKTNVEANAAKLNELLAALNGFKGESTLTLEQIQKTLTDLANADTDLAGALAELGAGIVDYSYNEATGIATVVLSNGQSLQVVVRDNAVDAVGKKADDGKYYWAVGGKFLEDAEGNKIPVSVTPKVKLDPETNKVSISADGGLTWVETDIVDEPAFFKAVDKDEDYVYFTLADGSEIKLARSNSAISITIPVMKMFVDYEATKTIDVAMANVDKYIIVKPEGWRASIKDGKLSVTAPAEGVGEAEGQIQIFAVGSDGRSAIYEVKVAAGPAPIEISVNVQDGTFDITAKDGTSYIYGVAVMDENTTLESVYEEKSASIAASDVKTGNQEGKTFEEVLGVEELPIKKLVVWVMAVDASGTGYEAQAFEDIFYKEYRPIKISFTSALDDANVTIEAAGETGDFIFAVTGVGSGMQVDRDPGYKQRMLDQAIAAEMANAGKTDGLKSLTLNNGKYEGKLIEGLYKDYTGKTPNSASLKPGYVWVLLVASKDNLTEDTFVYEFVQFTDYKYDEEANASVTISDIELTASSVSAKITPAEGCSYLYAIVSAADYAKLTTDQKKAEKTYTGSGGNKAATKVAGVAASTGLMPNSEYHLLIFVCDQEGRGKLVEKTLNTTGIPYNEDMSLNLTIDKARVNSADVTITATGGTIGSIRYGIMKKSDFDSKKDFGASTLSLAERMAMAGDLLAINKTVSNRRNFNKDNLKGDGKYTIENMYIMEPEQYLIVIAFDDQEKPVKVAYELIDTKTPFDNGFDANLADPIVRDVYYNTNRNGYSTSLTDAAWNKMSKLTDATTLKGKTGMYWLDLDWGTTTVKHMWLSAANATEWKNAYALTGNDMKADATAVLKKRYGTGSSAASPDFYGYNTTTGALSLAAVVKNTSEAAKNLVETDGSKTLHLVWETVEGKYGYMTVDPEEYLGTPENPDQPGTDPDTPVTPPATTFETSPWGHIWVWMDEEEDMYGALDLGASTSGKVTLAYCTGMTADGLVFTEQLSMNLTPETKIKMDNNLNAEYLELYDEMETEYRIYFTDLKWDSADPTKGTAFIWSPEGSWGEAVNGIPNKTEMRTPSAMGMPPVTIVPNPGPSIGNN